MYNGDAFYMLVIYLCGDGEAEPDEMQSQIIVCFIFYAICLFLKLCHNAQTRRCGDSPNAPVQQILILRFSSSVFCHFHAFISEEVRDGEMAERSGHSQRQSHPIFISGHVGSD